MDTETGQVARDGRRVAVGGRAYVALVALLRAQGRPLSTAEMERLLWPGTSAPCRASRVRVIMAGLRRTLGKPPAMETIFGEGYRLADR